MTTVRVLARPNQKIWRLEFNYYIKTELQISWHTVTPKGAIEFLNQHLFCDVNPFNQISIIA